MWEVRKHWDIFMFIHIFLLSLFRGGGDQTNNPPKRSSSFLRRAHEVKEREKAAGHSQDDSIVFAESKNIGRRVRPSRRGESFK